MQINSFPHPKEPRHLTSRLAVMAAGVYLQVCASDLCDGADIHADLCFSFHQLWVPATQGKGSNKQKHPRVCVHTTMVLPLVYWAPVAKIAREEIPKFGGAKSDTEKFGPLKAALGNIPALCANHTVRSWPPAHSRHFTQFSGNFRSGEQDLKPPLAYSCIGGLFRFASKRRARSETPR